ncbi:hypothetical protein ACVIWV_001006 [Bradyrhizobium diazoefficiens]|uniref:DUF4440 domain-containing protein n=1 Tax=Bradyrhizobium diazoefficiens TaxID=1355477 RepID=A0A0E4BL17_9BRAD|nr:MULTISPECIES: hypothetical protein [Bradyrhizobium]MBR0862336.1 hypothetical protein [Bradyrhizobium diazoefficiens]MBR0887062.1 hypothetical protein [Bradyrhizobium diazoefficiens]MBR0918798.1 hypothetical protein [Bradyrhizobium diazoefficiens]QHP68701.1 hypothetical protein EI171_16345 [Bradyrhizobium sp. LCT2]BAR54423.1 hypothetical protein NK6_1238 [Bradyrhizobium diazoefficiens]
MKFRRLLALAGVFFGMSTVALAQTQADDECLNPGNDELLKQGCSYLDEFMKAFNSRDAEAWAKTVHYPHIRIAAGQVQIWNTPEEYAQSNDAKQLAQASTWARSAWTYRKLVQESDDKLHFITRFTRYDANDKPILSADSFYVIVKKDGRWGALVRSSYVGIIGKKTAF